MKSLTRILLVGAVAVMAIAVSAAPSEAAKKKAKKAAATCGQAGTLCSAECVGTGCKVKVCGGDGKLYQAIFTPVCLTAAVCPKAC